MSGTELSLVIPTYNEKENVSKLLEKIDWVFKKGDINAEVIAVDDNSPDGTGEILDGLEKKYPFLKVVHRKGKLGLSSAVFDGWKIADSDILGVMDADLSHPVEKILEMFDLLDKNKADFVIGSRHVEGGEIIGWGIKRKAVSKIATLLAKLFTNVKDPMSGFFMIKKKCVEGKDFDVKGFKIALELLLKADYKTVKEVPITFVDRQQGKSELGLKEIFLYLNNLFHYLFYKKIHIEFFKFIIVGFIGLVINVAVLFYLTEFLGVYYLISAIFAFVLAVANNYFFNKTWTFKEKINDSFLSKGLSFFTVSIVALIVNLAFLYILTEFANIYYLISQIIAIGIAFLVNFFGNKIWTFNR